MRHGSKGSDHHMLQQSAEQRVSLDSAITKHHDKALIAKHHQRVQSPKQQV